jgi:hypothetical protein
MFAIFHRFDSFCYIEIHHFSWIIVFEFIDPLKYNRILKFYTTFDNKESMDEIKIIYSK